MCGIYKRLTEKSEQLLAEFPKLTQGELDAVSILHTGYLIYEDTGRGSSWVRKAWTSCCHHETEVHAIEKLETPETNMLRWARHNEEVICPFCGRRITAKNRKKIKRWNQYEEYIPVLFLHVSRDGSTVWGQAYWTKQDLEADPTGRILYGVTRVYRFREGEALMWEPKDYNKWDMRPCAGYWLTEPFSQGGCYGGFAPYRIIGLYQLKRSFLRYTMYDRPMTKYEQDLWSYGGGKRQDLIRYLAAAARYPRQVEMLRKADLTELVYDMVYNQKKNARVMKWGETDPRKAFDLSSQELKQFMETRKDPVTLLVYRKLKKEKTPVTMEQAARFGEPMTTKEVDKVWAIKKKYGAEPLQALKYLHTQSKGGALTTWMDYLNMAAYMEYPLHHRDVLYPKDLTKAHDDVMEPYNQRLEEIQEQEELKKAEAAAKAHLELTARREKRYGFRLGAYLIRAPRTPEEITREGVVLQHCVGGYADRHFKGRTTILFMRQVSKPERPFITIEMDGNEIVQIHGYRNECKPCKENPDRKSPRVLYKDFLDSWLEWLKGGSKRDKTGNPVLMKKKEDKIA